MQRCLTVNINVKKENHPRSSASVVPVVLAPVAQGSAEVTLTSWAVVRSRIWEPGSRLSSRSQLPSPAGGLFARVLLSKREDGRPAF